ncbi:hypothetical protein [Aureimonas leprariae]|uniref:RES domain-containing protein n=1 Tax=Plantimonas leprariae TaxID=2615207 RepID=A0A7V7PNY3_9HYPH|nr:hypothetical protein [Aureimonas leprariae]KAB0679547.1 hypothetical protein F6X38_12035 [Aureimonas leprariae]
MPLYHATWRERLPAIRREGIRADVATKNHSCENGVYLADSPLAAAYFLIEAYVQRGRAVSDPAERASAIVIIVVDDARFDRSALEPDPGFTYPVFRTFVHPGRIDVRNATIIGVNDLLER